MKSYFILSLIAIFALLFTNIYSTEARFGLGVYKTIDYEARYNDLNDDRRVENQLSFSVQWQPNYNDDEFYNGGMFAYINLSDAASANLGWFASFRTSGLLDIMVGPEIHIPFHYQPDEGNIYGIKLGATIPLISGDNFSIKPNINYHIGTDRYSSLNIGVVFYLGTNKSLRGSVKTI
jgi:hypothetical protein